jgi:hypothetical protein
MQPAALPHDRLPISSMLRSFSGNHTASTRMPTRSCSGGMSRMSWRLSMPPGSSSMIDAFANGSVFSWP